MLPFVAFLMSSIAGDAEDITLHTLHLPQDKYYGPASHLKDLLMHLAVIMLTVHASRQCFVQLFLYMGCS